MAKKKSSDKTIELRDTDAESEAALVADAEPTHDGAIVEAATPGYVAAEELWLVTEVQAFLTRRGELAEKLAREIEATELKLAELKRTAALLTPPPAASPEPTRADKKAKKPTLKKAEKKTERKPEANSEGTEAPTDNSSGDADTAEPHP